MLPDRERHALREIEAELKASDPAFAAALSGRSMREATRWKLLLVLCDVTAVGVLAVRLFGPHAGPVPWGPGPAGGAVGGRAAPPPPRRPTPVERPPSRAHPLT